MIETINESGYKLLKIISFKKEEDFDEQSNTYGEYVTGEVLLQDSDSWVREVWYIRQNPPSSYCISFSHEWEQFYLEFGYTPS